MRKDQLLGLIIKRLGKNLTVEGQIELDTWLAQDSTNKAWLNSFMDEGTLQREIEQWRDIDPTEGYTQWRSQMHIRRKGRVRRIGWSAAASVVIIAGVILLTKRSPLRNISTPTEAIVSKVLPGRNTAILTLGNGQQVLLDSMGIGEVARQGGADLRKPDSGSLSYSASNEAKGTAFVYNTLATPRAGQFKLQLPDGTQVWLNNASSLTYPSSFTGNTRMVTLTGEAYFEVAKDAIRTFQVKAGGVIIDVLGTGFNLSAYPDEPDIRTTLVQGKIRVQSGLRSAVLQPEQQVDAGLNGAWTLLKKVDTEEATAWRFGLFNFNNADLHSVMRQLARWYDIDYEFRSHVPDKRVQGQIQRSLTLDQVLEILQDKDVHFMLEGRKLVIT